jgi:hypothetical protein
VPHCAQTFSFELLLWPMVTAKSVLLLVSVEGHGPLSRMVPVNCS